MPIPQHYRIILVFIIRFLLGKNNYILDTQAKKMVAQRMELLLDSSARDKISDQ